MNRRELAKHYENLYIKSRERISAGDYEPDALIDSSSDSRRGITLLLRPSGEGIGRIGCFLEEMAAVDPRQYYYPPSDMHITVLSLITCHERFDLSQINTADYADLLGKVLRELPPFSMEFRGLTASPSCVMIQGFPRDETLPLIRERLRAAFRESPLSSTIDSRYEIKTAHSTVIRLREKLSDPDGYLAVLERYRDFSFGTFEATSLELVGNDWYQRAENTVRLADFPLG